MNDGMPQWSFASRELVQTSNADLPERARPRAQRPRFTLLFWAIPIAVFSLMLLRPRTVALRSAQPRTGFFKKALTVCLNNRNGVGRGVVKPMRQKSSYLLKAARRDGLALPISNGL